MIRTKLFLHFYLIEIVLTSLGISIIIANLMLARRLPTPTQNYIFIVLKSIVAIPIYMANPTLINQVLVIIFNIITQVRVCYICNSSFNTIYYLPPSLRTDFSVMIIYYA